MSNLEIKIGLDGDKYCALVGDDLQTGLAGFGVTPCEALRELVDEFEIHFWNIDGLTIQ